MMSETSPQTRTPALQPAADWQRLLRVALLGSRQAPEALPDAGLVLPEPETHPDYREKQLLLAAGTLSLIRKAGFRPAPAPALAPGAPAAAPDAEPALGPAGAQLLQQLLDGTHASLLRGFLEDLPRHQRRVPHQLLVPLLEYARPRRDVHAATAAVLGQRGRWLAAQNPAWQPIVAGSSGASDETVWETGTLSERVAFLAQLRGLNPTQARELLVATLPQEPAKNQTALLDTLSTELSTADEALLEQYLTSKNKEVRQSARLLLVRVPGSGLVERLWRRAEPLVQLKRGLLSKKLLVELPAEAWDKPWLADGIEQRDTRFAGDKAALLGQMLALLPPERWSAHWNLSPVKLLDLAAGTEWAALLLSAWAEATQLHQDQKWAIALLEWFYEQPRKQLATLPAAGIAQVLSATQLTDLVLPLLNATPHLTPEVRWLPLLHLVPAPWPERLTRRVVELLRDALSRPEQLHRIHYAASQLLEYMARVVPAAQHDLCAQPLQPLLQNVPYLHNGLARLLNALHLRQQLIEALQEPPGPG
ncbi:DUF5691 domain-containing protein [Hymenobacter glacieicola]|uniref:HEAT repeat domain-containing protein n=1 Tax=Hymenobacter glacieicola TaxID=1562124 RepID=A0ABQ1X0Z5_9BACT|nr:DUF5691 domain-containing protein [Hymenobacter glacieicola]GGG49936.1 hypothetical protein GCM10011378_27530 [Hymenobacter glacieicola]